MNIERFSFPDGQPHVIVKNESAETELVVRITNPKELFETLLIGDALTQQLGRPPELVVSYLMGARMDRAMPEDERGFHPFTLDVVCKVLDDIAWPKITVFDPHSPVTTTLLGAERILPVAQVRAALLASPPDTLVVVPDAGAVNRTADIIVATGIVENLRLVYLQKKRDPATGKLSGFQFAEGSNSIVNGYHCLIVDDICDGGGTFVGQAEVLRNAGAAGVSLFVSHGIFSNKVWGFNLPGIDHIFTTNSYRDWGNTDVKGPNMTVFPWRIT